MKTSVSMTTTPTERYEIGSFLRGRGDPSGSLASPIRALVGLIMFMEATGNSGVY
jgi:hypothetical protein